MKKLPIGIQTFSKIIEDNCYYVDKTRIVSELAASGGYFFLSRPRRFGKSLFLDTLKEAFSGNRDLFKGLYLEKNWNWELKYPVIKISFGNGAHSLEGLHSSFEYNLRVSAEDHSVSLEGLHYDEKFKDLIRKISIKYNEKVVILIDEYDKPILDNLTYPETAVRIREELRSFYSVIKDSDAFVRFVFITGVSKFSKINLFSGLNNLQDITLDRNFSSICGYTQSELLNVFQDGLADVNMDELKLWYNGYNFLGEKVYNPFDILLYLKNKEFKNYWFETGNPSFLIELIHKNNYNSIDIENVEITEESLGSFDVDMIELETLLFQTGYLTIDKKYNIGAKIRYRLKYPNMEVRMSLTEVILKFLTDSRKTVKIESELYRILEKNDLDAMQPLFHSFFASIPHDWYRKNTMANYEGYYASIFYCYFTSLGLDVRTEDVTNQGQVDMTVFFEDRVYVFEFKVIELAGPGSALAQIKTKRYYEKYLSAFTGTQGDIAGTHGRASLRRENIYLIGVEFSRDSRNIEVCEWEKL